MRKTLPLIEMQLFELFANFQYKLPKDPELMMYDFYFLTAFGNAIQTRDLDADYAVEEATDIVIDSMHHHMKQAVFFSLCAEIRHLFDVFKLTGLDREISKEYFEFTQEYYKEFAFIIKASEKVLTGLMLDNPHVISPRDRDLLSQNDTGTRRASHTAIKTVMKKFGWGKFEFGKYCETMYGLPSRWSPSYGGKAWAGIGRALWKLEVAKKKLQKIIWIDHAYDLQHNTDTVFNKIKMYSKDGGYDWIKTALDWKRDNTDMTLFYKKVSPQLKPLVAYISKNVYNKTVQGPKPVPSLKKLGDLSLGDFVKAIPTQIAIPNAEAEKFAKVYKLKNWKINRSPILSRTFNIVAIGPIGGNGEYAIAIEDTYSKKQYIVPPESVEKTTAPSADLSSIHTSAPSITLSGKFKTYDKVIVTDAEKAVITGTALADEAGLTNYTQGVKPSKSLIYKVVWAGIGALADYAAIESKGGEQFVMKISGISLAKGFSSDSSESSGEFNIGDGVKVKFVGMSVTGDTGMANDAGLTNYKKNYLPDVDKIYTVLWNSPTGIFVGIEDDISGDQFLIKAQGLTTDFDIDTAETQTPEFRTLASNNYKFDYGTKVEFISTQIVLPIDNVVKQWGQENGISLSDNIAHVGEAFTFEVQKTGEHDYFPGKVVVLIKPLEGPYTDETYLVDQNIISKIQPRAELDFKFEIGQTVKVINPWKAYTHYNAWANEHDFQLDSTDEPSSNFVYKIIARGPHDNGNSKLYGIKDIEGIHFIMDEKGLELFVSSSPVDEPDNYSMADSDVVPEYGPVRTRPSDGTFIDISSYSYKWSNVQLDSSVSEYIGNNINKYKWLVEASINSVKLSLGDDGKILWLSGNWNNGTWKNGTWEDGEWLSGTWKNGIWNGGNWYDGFWSNGIWKGGVHHKGTWRKGTWHKGTWRAGVWEDGYWKSGDWESGTWKGGKWKSGNWTMGEIEDYDGVALYSTEAPGQ